jgi:hypothetical protein
MCCYSKSILNAFYSCDLNGTYTKKRKNLAKHGVDFSTVGIALSDPHRLIFRYPGMGRDELRCSLRGTMGMEF